MSSPRPRVFYGWWVVLTAGLGLMLGAPMIPYSFGVFISPLTREFHAGRAAISLAFTVFNLAVTFGSPLAGRLVDRHGGRRVILPYAMALGAVLVSAEMVASKIWELYLFYLAVGLTGSGVIPLAYGKVVSHWFDRRRGLALGVMMCGAGLGAIIMPSLMQRLIARFDWRAAYATAGLAVLLVAVPVIAAFLKERPERMGLLPDGALLASAGTHDETDPGLSWQAAWHGGTFWLMLCAFCLAGASIHGCLIHMPSMLADRHATARAAALASSILGAGMLLSRLIAGYLVDRFFAPYIGAFFFGGLGVGLLLLRSSNAIAVAFLAAFLVGVAFGAEGDLIMYLTTRYFGLRSFGEIYGYTFAAFTLTGALSAYGTGAGFDLTGSYAIPLTVFFVATLVAIILLMRLGPYRYGVREPYAVGPTQPVQTGA